MKEKLMEHQSVRIGSDLVVTGGGPSVGGYSKSIYKLSCTNKECKWETLKKQLQTARREHVAVAVPDDFFSPSC